jgi:hypothetical protein
MVNAALELWRGGAIHRFLCNRIELSTDRHSNDHGKCGWWLGCLHDEHYELVAKPISGPFGAHPLFALVHVASLASSFLSPRRALRISLVSNQTRSI